MIREFERMLSTSEIGTRSSNGDHLRTESTGRRQGVDGDQTTGTASMPRSASRIAGLRGWVPRREHNGALLPRDDHRKDRPARDRRQPDPIDQPQGMTRKPKGRRDRQARPIRHAPT